ncbi:hypothetical protein K3495_g4921 [Podosphaera aphanis]|nr:hypothetical protein K3495_g4921 [Podosphaera aphanis]
MREFIAITDTMTQNGIRIGTTLSKDKPMELGLLLEIDLSNLKLIPDNFDFRKVKTRPAIVHDRVVSITDKLRQMKLICRNEILHRKFPEWGIVELCHEESMKIFADYMSNVFKNKDRLAITVRDLESAPIVELGRLRCRRLHGTCLTPRPREEELEIFSKSNAMVDL